MAIVTPSLLEPTGNEAAERAAIADRERPGSWYGDAGADGRSLTQEQTEALIRAELVRVAPRSEREEVLGAVGGRPRTVRFGVHPMDSRTYRAGFQRGGIDSDPLVRLLAFRAWGNRDRAWFEQRGIRSGDRLALVHGARAPAGWDFPQSEVAIARDGDRVIGIAGRDAHPGAALEFQVDIAAVGSMSSKHSSDLRNTDGRWWWTLSVSARRRLVDTGGVHDEGIPTHEELLCIAYGFDRLHIEDARSHGRHHATVSAERGTYQAQAHLDASDLGNDGAADLWHRCYTALGRELHRLEAAREKLSGDAAVHARSFR